MNETKEKIDLFTKRHVLGQRIVKIIDERGLKDDKDIEALEEHKEFIRVENELREKFGLTD